jgi:glutathione S-transferase
MGDDSTSSSSSSATLTPTPPSSASSSHYTIYVLPGSQYCAKVLAALDASNIPHDVVSVAFDPKKRSEELPSGGRKVPEMKVVVAGDNDQAAVVLDSEGILRWFDDNRGTQFFPEVAAGELSTRAGDGILAGCVLYYNWVNSEGYARSVRKSIKEQVLPQWLPFRGKVTDVAVKSERAKFRVEVLKMLSVKEEQLASEPFVRQMLVEELEYFQSHLASADQPYLLGNKPTAADFSVYAQLERLVGDTGDAQVFCSLPELLDTTHELERLWQWYRGMRARHPILFHGKDPQKLPSLSKATKKGPRSPRTPLQGDASKRMNLAGANQQLQAPPVTP